MIKKKTKRAARKTVKRAIARKPAKRQVKKSVPFDALSPKAKRVAIAKDVLAQIGARKFIATRGIYVDIDAQDLPAAVKEMGSDQQVCDIFAKAKKCGVCALGSMFMSAAGLHDKLTVSGTGNGPQGLSNYGFSVGSGVCYEYLEKFFSHEQLRMMEQVFEGTGGNATVRLKAIMGNVVRNEGVYVPSEQQDRELELGYYAAKSA